MPIYYTGALDAYAINTEISQTTFNVGKSPTATLSLNASDARGLSGIPSGTIKYSDFYGCFQMYDGYDGYYGNYGYNSLGYAHGALSSTGFKGQTILGIWYVPSSSKTYLTIQSGSDLGYGFWSSLKIGSNFTYQSSWSRSYQPASPGYTIWYISGDQYNLTGLGNSYVSCRIT